MTERRVLIGVPAFNEAATIADVVERIRTTLPKHDLIVVDDGSWDGTGAILAELGVPTLRHLCNMGYGRAVQTAILHTLRHEYDMLVTIDADGQHQPEQIAAILDSIVENGWDLCVGSRYVRSRSYSSAPLGRGIGMRALSLTVYLITGQRIWDTTSGLRVIARSALERLAHWHFVDFHAEAIVYLVRLGYRVGEHPVTVEERRHGRSMYSPTSAFKYPLKTMMLVLLGLAHASLERRRSLQ